MRVGRFAYRAFTTPLLSLTSEGTVELELLLAPAPLGIEGLEVRVEEVIASQLTAMGLTPAFLGNRWIDKERIDAIQVKRDLGVIIELTQQMGPMVVRPENLTTGSENIGLCIALQRARSAGSWNCALTVLNGVPISGIQALIIPPETIESMAVLLPREAVTHYGTLGGPGAVLIWTTNGRD